MTPRIRPPLARADGECRGLVMLAVVLIVVGWYAPAGRAQWATQTNRLNAGWNAVYLHVAPSHTNVSGLVRALDPIEEVWLWSSELPPGHSLATPPPGPPGSQWSSWTRIQGTNSTLKSLGGNSALLVRLADGVAAHDWCVQGHPVPPRYLWTLSGLNFVGFPTAEPAPTFEAFLDADAQSLDWKQHSEIFHYPGGALGPANPAQIGAWFFRSNCVARDRAYWMRAGEATNQFYNRYFGPFQVRGVGASGIHFGDDAGQTRLWLKNMSAERLTITLRQEPSDTAPAGQTPIAGTLPLLLRGALNPTNLTFGYSRLASGPCQWTLAPEGEAGSEVEVILGLDRSQMGAMPGVLFAGVLRFTDSLGPAGAALTRVDIGASATTPSRAGLWVGSASVEYVSQYLKPYAQATNQAGFQALLTRLGLGQGVDGYRYEWAPNTGRVLVFGGPQNRKGSYLLDGPIQFDSGGVARPFPLRLIVHNDGAANRLLQRAYIGFDSNSNVVVATLEDLLLASQLATARRVSAVHLPTSDGNLPWVFEGAMREGTNLTTMVRLDAGDHASNPFLHTYHPDHDNRDALFAEELEPGIESYGVQRRITLEFTAPAADFASLTRSATALSGHYAETVTFLGRGADSKQFHVLGTFEISRVANIATLATR